MSVYSVDRCVSLFFHPPFLYPSTHQSLCLSYSLLLDLLRLSIRPSRTQSQLDIARMLLACYYCSSFLCGWVRMKRVRVPRHRITSMSLSVSPLHRPQCSSFNPPIRHKACDFKKWLNTGSLFIVPFSVSHSVPAEPCPGQRGAVPTMSPTSCHRGRDQGHPLPTLCSPPPARPTGQPRGWCGCRRRSMALR